MKEQIRKMKLELKALAKEIRTQKSQRNKDNNGFVHGLYQNRIKFRHLHVAYCLIRGRKLEECDSGKDLNMDWVNWIIDLTKPEPETKKKLFVIVNNKLSPSQKAVQAGHAVAGFLKAFPNTQWDNGYLIYLQDEPGSRGDLWIRSFHMGADKFCFKEPDLDNKITAYAVFGYDTEHITKYLKLL